MQHAAIAATLFATTVVLSALLVRRSINLGIELGIVDTPTSRSVSQRTVPRLGGLPIAVAFLVGIGLSFSLGVDRFPSEVERVALLCIAGSIVAFVLVIDDAVGMSVPAKLAVQTGAACLVVAPRLRGSSHGISIDQFNVPLLGQVSVPLVAAIPLTLVWFVAMMNTMNWVDGIDGLAASVTLVAGSVLFVHTYFWPRGAPQFTISLLPLVMIAAVLGFLPFNWHPSKIMLGDSGSNFLGFVLAAISIIGGAKMATALLVLGLPLLDVAWVIAQRGIGHRPITQGDRSHIHHRLIERGWTQSQIVLFVAGVSAVFGAMALLLPNRESKLFALVVLGGVLLLTAGRIRRHSLPR